MDRAEKSCALYIISVCPMEFLLSKFVWFVSYATYKLSPGWEGKKEARGRSEVAGKCWGGGRVI